MNNAGVWGVDERDIDEHEVKELIAAELTAVRSRSLTYTDADDDLLVRQHSALMSPLVWDLAHVGNYEELWVLREAGGITPLRPEIDDLYDAFKHPRRDRPSLPILGPEEARRYISGVRGRVLDVLDEIDLNDPDPLRRNGFVFGLVIQHEHQHDETMLATLQLSGRPGLVIEGDLPPAGAASGAEEVFVPGGPFVMGTDLLPWAYDNERPAHRVDLPAYWIDRFPVSNGAYLAFIEDGGYDDPRWWSAEACGGGTRAAPPRRCSGRRTAAPGGAPASAAGSRCPRTSRSSTCAGTRPTPTPAGRAGGCPPRPSGRRPAAGTPWRTGHASIPGGRGPRPRPGQSRPPRGPPGAAGRLPRRGQRVRRRADDRRGVGVDLLALPALSRLPQLPYPEYSEVFFGSDYRVLRGGSWAADPAAVRTTFRNWDYPIRRQIFSGFRCARSASPEEV
nr:hypothetical protein GCM10020093_012150 [Planobispora longispora]